jgi:hypothetical protein
MPIDRLYYYGLSILALGFCCVTNYHMWPEKGYLPHQNVGNRFRKDPEEVKKEQQREAKKKEEKKQQKRERKQRKRESEERREERRRRRKADRDDGEEPEWIADFSRKHSERSKHADSIPLSTPAPAAKTGRPRRVSFEDQQRPDAGMQRNGNVANGYIPYDYIYGSGAVSTTEGTRPHGVRSPPGAAGHGQHNGGVQSPGSSNKQSVGSPPGGSNRSKHATVQSNSDTVSPPRFQGGIATPGSRPFSADAGMA